MKLYLYQYDITKKTVKKAAVDVLEKPKSYKRENGEAFPFYPVHIIHKSDVGNPYTIRAWNCTYISTSDNEKAAVSLFYDYYREMLENSEHNAEVYRGHVAALRKFLKEV